MNRILFYILILTLGVCGGKLKAQFQPKTILIKFHKSATQEALSNPDLVRLMQHSKGVITKVFPTHSTPQEPTNSYGDSYIDLSLWFQLNYENNISELLLISKLKSTGFFQFVEQRPQNHLFYLPNDSLLVNQFYLNTIHAYSAWDLEKGDTNVVVGVVDTGIDRVHEDLKDAIKYNYGDTVDGLDNDNDGFIDNYCGWDIGNNDNNVQWGPIGHGTFVAGFVSAVPDNNKGIAGVGFNVKVLPVKIDNDDGILIHDYEGIVYAADHGCCVINCSWGGPVFSQFGKDVVDYASVNRDALVVAASGNSNNEVWMYPASYKSVLSVAATDSLDVRWSQSSYGTQIDISAPGTAVYSTWVNNGYLSSHGTSFSAPIVAAAAALLKSKSPQLTAYQLREQLRVSADDIDTILGNSSVKDGMGAGRLNIERALTDSMFPSIRISESFIDITNGVLTDTVQITGWFTNYLAQSSANLQARVSCESPYLLVIDSVYLLGILGTQSSTNNINHPFKFKVLPGAPLGYQADIKISYKDGLYEGFEFLRVELNKDYTEIDTNKIELTLTSSSRLGFNDDDQNQGIGMIYKGGRNLLSIGGLLLATSGNLVSDNIYSDQGYSHDFRTLEALNSIINPDQGDQFFYTEFNDDSAGFEKLNLKVKQYSYAYNQTNKDKFVIIEYCIRNMGTQVINGLSVALYADFDVGEASKNKASYHEKSQMAYTYPIDGGKYAGISLLSGSNPNIYNIDNDGSNGSVGIYDGFYSFEKYQTMTQQRDSAGYGLTGGDVSHMLSAGPYNLAPGDSIVLCYAVLAGDNLYDLLQVSSEAYNTYHNTLSVSETIYESNSLFSVQPNPASEATQIIFYNPRKQRLSLKLYDSYGHLVRNIANSEYPEGNLLWKLKTSSLSNGIYFIRISSGSQTQNLSLLIAK